MTDTAEKRLAQATAEITALPPRAPIISRGAAPFKPGDVVMLKSGGPRMTVYDISSDGMVEVEWFGPKGVQSHGRFSAPELRRSRWWDAL